MSRKTKCFFTQQEKEILIALTVTWVIEQGIASTNIKAYLIGVLSNSPNGVNSITKRLSTLKFVQAKGDAFTNGVVQKLLDRVVGRTPSDKLSSTYNDSYKWLDRLILDLYRSNVPPRIEPSWFGPIPTPLQTADKVEPFQYPLPETEVEVLILSKKDQYILVQAIEDIEFLQQYITTAPVNMLEYMATAFAEFSL